MKSLQTIVEEYRRADDEERLFYFLEHRLLRNQFVRIEYDEYRTKLQETPASGKKPARGLTWRGLWARFAFHKL